MGILYRPLGLAALGFLGLTLLGAALSSANQMAEAMRAVEIPLVVMILSAYSVEAMQGLWSRSPAAQMHLILGIFSTWSGTLGLACWSLLFRLSHQPLWMLSSDVPNFFNGAIIFGGALHISAPDAMNGVPRRSAIIFGACLAVGVGVAVGYVYLNPDLVPLTDRLRPWLEDKRLDRSLHRPDLAPAPLDI